MEIITGGAQATQKLGEKIANYLINPEVILGRSEAMTPESRSTNSGQTGFWTREFHSLVRMTKEKSRGNQATIFALYGELGSGKTIFVRGLAHGLGLPHRILSPTFIVVREYPLQHKTFRMFYHLDLYRMENEADLETLGLAEIFQNPAHLVAIEWAQRLGKLLPQVRMDIRFEQINADQRRIIIQEL